MGRAIASGLGVLGMAAMAFVACGSGDEGSGGTAQSPAERMCGEVEDAIARCGAGACDQAILADCAKLAAVLSDPFLNAAADCLDNGGTPSACLGSALGALTPTAGQAAFISSFCADCPPVPIPACEDALLGKGSVPDQLKDAKKLIMPFGDAVLKDVETQCFGGLTCLAELSSCVQQVLVSRAIPTNTVQCLVQSLASGSASGSDAGCTADAGSDATAAGGSGGSAGSGGAAGAGGSAGSGAGGSAGSGGSGGSSGSGGASGGSGGASGGAGGTGGSGGSSGGCPADTFEPNNEASAAKTIDTGGDGKISDCEPSQTLKASIGLSDVADWYTFYGLDGICGIDDIQPHAKVTAATPLNVCVYLKPAGSSAAPTCLEGSPATIAGGFTGCCGVNGARLKYGSIAANDEGTVLIYVAGTNLCTAYTLEYDYGK